MTGARRGWPLGAVVIVLGAAGLLVQAAGVRAQSPALPDGRGKAEFQRVCAGCHPAEDAVKGARRSRADWRRIVDDMVVRGAESSEGELTLVIDYLTEHFGPPSGRR